jgi:hypothetical protein
MSDVFFQILTPMPLNSQGEARKLFKIWAQHAPGFFPDRTVVDEPRSEPFSLDLLDEALRHWTYMFSVKRAASPKLEANVFMQHGPHRDGHSTWTISLRRLRDFDQAVFSNLLRHTASAFNADFGFIHHITEAEIKRKQDDTIGFLDTARTEKTMFVTTHDLKKYVPDVYWTTIFGAPYVTLFSREKLLSSPVHRVEELENGSVVLQLTPDLRDTVTHEAAFEGVRKAVKDHLDSDAFLDPRKGTEHRYAVPEFVWSPVLD